MFIRDPNHKQAANVTKDGKLNTLAISTSYMHSMAEVGKAWSITGGITNAANTTDNPIFYMENTSDETFDCHGIFITTSAPGIFAIEYGRGYTSGGTAGSLSQFDVLSGKTQNQVSWLGPLVLSGTGTDLTCLRAAADTTTDLLLGQQCLQLEPGAKIAVRFKGDAGGESICFNYVCHGIEPWE